MTGWRATLQRWSLVLALAGGLVAMHSLVLAGGGGVGHPVGTVETTPMTMAGAPAQSSHRVSPARSAIAPPADARPGRSGHHGDGMSMLLHLCLAVLGALLLALAAPLLLHVLDRAAPAGSRAGPSTARSHPRAPPPTPVRLAQLCVSRR